MQRRLALQLAILSVVLLVSVPAVPREFFVTCGADNDLYRVLLRNGMECSRYDTAKQAIESAPEGSAVLILAGDYPTAATEVDPALLARAERK
ncbi:MAG TPA: hypothetical protein ENN87_14360, partial [Phycisphaerales bacterium]|nr:hypothetical protein [Phycisphaerales bacterium]